MRNIFIVLGLILSGAGLLALIGCSEQLFSPSPEQYAAATATIMKANSIAAADAIANAGTAVAIAQSAAATRTFEPLVVARAQNQAAAGNVGDWTNLGLAVAGWSAVILLVGACGLFVRTRARILPRSRDGQAQPVLIGNTVIDPTHAIGPAVTAPQSPGWLDELDRLLRWRKTGQLPAPSEPCAQLTDGGADADHYLAAAQSATQATIMAAMMRPDQSDAQRKQRLEIVTKHNGASVLGGGGTSITRVVGVGDSAVDAFARAIAHEMGDHLIQSAPATVEPLPGNGAATPRLELPADASSPPISDEAWARSKPLTNLTDEDKEERA